MRILYSKAANGKLLVDFAQPIGALPDQLDEIIKMLRESGVDIKTESVLEKARSMIRQGGVAHPWTYEEMLLVLDPNISEKEIENKTSHSEFGVHMMRGQLLSAYFKWCNDKGLDSREKKNQEKYLKEVE